jgi:hypothetical protein
MTANASPDTPDPVFVSLNEQFQRMLDCRGAGVPEGALDPAFAEEEAKLCEMLVPVLTRLARGREEWANGALFVLCCRWRRGLMDRLTLWYLRICVKEAARQECEGWVPLLGDGVANRADATPEPADELTRRAEAGEARQQLARLAEEVARFVGSLADRPELQALARAMLAADDLSRGFGSRYAREQKMSPSGVTKMKQELERRFDDHLRAVPGLPRSRLGFSEIVLKLREGPADVHLVAGEELP